MKPEIRELLTDFKAAVRIGHPETLDLALDGLRALPQVAGNSRMEVPFIERAILPLGRILAHRNVRSAYLRALLSDPFAGVRAVAATALAQLYFLRENVTQNDLRRPSLDPRPDVRAALGKALGSAGEARPDRLLALITWLLSSSGQQGEDISPRTRQVALTAALPLAALRGESVLEAAARLCGEEDPDVRAALVEVLTALARAGLAEPVLGLLAAWARQPNPNSWIITRALSASWAASHAGEAETVLRDLESQTGPTRQIANARDALGRHQA